MCRLTSTLYLLLVIFVGCSLGERSSAIPDILLNCYRTNLTDHLPKMPLTIRLLIEQLRKLEFDKGEPHIRVLTNAILHTVKLDGVVKGTNADLEDGIVPFRALSNQFTKYQFLVDHLTPGDTLQFPRDVLNDTDLCVLHYIISNTIVYENRGNGINTCSMDKPVPLVNGREKDVCLLEKGVIKSKWGTISGGHLIAGIASALQRDTVTLGRIVDDIGKPTNFTERTRTQRINNVWVSTIAGDLAEVLINQGSTSPKLGAGGYWNDTLLPRNHYLAEDNWDMTEAELLGGFDAMVLAKRAKEWVSSFEKIRLSQLIEMYYSERGVAFDPSSAACWRRKGLEELKEATDLVEQVSGAAKILQTMGRYGVTMQEAAIDEVAPGVVETYKKFAESLLSNYDACQQRGDIIGRLEIIAVLDETWSRYEAEKFISHLTDEMDVSHYGSRLGIINGHSGAWLTNVTGDLVQLYTDLHQTSQWPTRISLTESLHRAIFHYQNVKDSDCNFAKAYGKIILFLAQSTQPTDGDSSTATASLRTLANSYPETKIVFVTSEDYSRTYKAVAKESRANVNLLIADASDSTDSIVRRVAKLLRSHPANILNFYCNNSISHFEDYLTPGLAVHYEIHGQYAARANISVKFKGNGYGDASVCAYDAKSMADKTCKGITVNSEVTFNIKDHCPADAACSVQFAVSVSNSSFKCSELDCRYPDQLRLDIFTSWSRASGLATYTHILLLLNIYLLI